MICRLPRSFLLPTLLLAFSALAGIPRTAEGQATPPAGGVGAGEATPGAFLGDLTWTEAEERFAIAPIVILPFGAGAKEHGPHLPMNADAVVMEFLCQVAVDSLPVVVAPPMRPPRWRSFRSRVAAGTATN